MKRVFYITDKIFIETDSSHVAGIINATFCIRSEKIKGCIVIGDNEKDVSFAIKESERFVDIFLLHEIVGDLIQNKVGISEVLLSAFRSGFFDASF